MATASNKTRRARPLLGTFVEIEAKGAVASEVHRAIDAAFEAVAIVHRLMSFHDFDSDVSRLNREAFDRPIKVHDWTFRVLETAIALHRRSNGIFNVAVAPLLQSRGLLPSSNGEVPADSVARDAVELLDGQMVRFQHRHVRIDLGGIAKGFAVDQALGALRKSGEVNGGLVNAGGDLAAFGTEPQSVHIRHPRDPGRAACRIEITDEALASTARRFDPYHSSDTTSSAIVGPAGGPPVDGIDGVTVRAPTCMIADALTKAVMISGTNAAGLLELYHANALLLSANGDVQISPEWQHAVHLAA